MSASRVMNRDKNGKKYFQREFIKKLKFYYNNDEVKSTIKKLDPKELIDCYGMTLLHHAVTARNMDLVEYLIARGFEVDALDNKMKTPLALAICNNDVRMMKVLLAAGADVFIRDQFGFIKMGVGGDAMEHVGIAEMLFEELKKKYSNDVKMMARILLDINHPFPRAMLLKNTAVTKYMLKKGCSVHDTDFNRDTALHFAVECMHLGNVKLLLELGAAVHAINGNLDTPIHYYHFGKEENYEILHLLLDHGASLVDNNDDGFSVISKTFENEKAEHVKALLEYGGLDLNELDFADCTPVHYLARNKNPGVMELLQDRSFEVDVRDNKGRSPLFIAAEYANPDAVEFLLKKGADPKLVDDEGEMVLCYSVRWQSMGSYFKDNTTNYVKCVELLIQYGADVQFVGTQQNTLFDDAKNLTYVQPAIAQVAMMKALEQQVNGVILDKIQSCEVLMKYFDVCLLKLEEIKNTVICGDVKLSAFLVESEKKLLIYARNEECRAILETYLCHERSSSLYFVKILCSRIETIVEFVKLREQAVSSVCEISGCYYRPVIDKIVGFLDEQSMKNVCQV